MGGEYLGAGDAPALPVARRGGFQVGDRGPGVGFGHADRDHRLAGEQPLEIAFLVRRGPILREHADRPESSRLYHIRAARTDASDGLDREHGVEERPALAAIRLGDGDAKEPLLCHEARDVPWIVGRMRTLARAGREILLGETAYGAAELLLLRRKPEVHGHSFSASSASTATPPSRFTIPGFASASRIGRPGTSASRDSAATARASASM